jgi:hypothetical protein
MHRDRENQAKLFQGPVHPIFVVASDGGNLPVRQVAGTGGRTGSERRRTVARSVLAFRDHAARFARRMSPDRDAAATAAISRRVNVRFTKGSNAAGSLGA